MGGGSEWWGVPCKGYVLIPGRPLGSGENTARKWHSVAQGGWSWNPSTLISHRPRSPPEVFASGCLCLPRAQASWHLQAESAGAQAGGGQNRGLAGGCPLTLQVTPGLGDTVALTASAVSH